MDHPMQHHRTLHGDFFIVGAEKTEEINFMVDMDFAFTLCMGVNMLIKSSTTLRNEYDKIVGLSKARQEPVYITRNGEGEMVFLPIEAYERREAELTLLEKLLMAEQNRLDGAPTYPLDEVAAELEDIYAGV